MEEKKFSIRDVCELLNLPVDHRRRSVTVECPLCSKHGEKKLNINFEKDAFRCAKCGISGYAIHLWALYRNLDFNDLTSAAKDFYSVNEHKTVEIPRRFANRSYKPISTETEDIDIRNRTFSEFLKILSLSKEHEDALLKRGLNKEAIAEYGYKSYPVTGYESIAKILLERGCILKGCPGFYLEKDNKWALRHLSPGILIPQRDGFGRIQGFQIRLDNDASCRYLTLSTGENYKLGAKGFANPHFREGIRGFKEIILTEGPLKGDIISHFTGYSVLALQGVNSISRVDSIFSELSEKGTEIILTAFDMDLKTNEMVKEALSKIEEKISDAGLSYQQLCWDEKYKGLDDWLLANHKVI